MISLSCSRFPPGVLDLMLSPCDIDPNKLTNDPGHSSECLFLCTRLMTKRRKKLANNDIELDGYGPLLNDISSVLESSRRAAARTVNTILTLTYWDQGRRIVEYEQSGEDRAQYGQALLQRLSKDLSKRFGRGFSRTNLQQMRAFYRHWPIRQTLSGESLPSLLAKNHQTLSGISEESQHLFPLPWSHYVELLSIKNKAARDFYESEAVRGGWSIRQLKRQIGSQFYERTAMSKNKASMLSKGQQPEADDAVSADEAIKDPFVLEFLNLKDEYSESDLEAALVSHLESFLLELGGEFTFVGRQRRLRIDDEWYRIDLLFFHRRLRCLVIIDLKLGKLTHADAGQMHMYLNYAKEHWTLPEENPPVGLILCAAKGSMLAKYSLDGLPNQVRAREYRTTLPKESSIVAELERTRSMFESKSDT